MHQEMATLVSEKGEPLFHTHSFSLCNSSVKGVNSFKMFLAYKDLFMLRDDEASCSASLCSLILHTASADEGLHTLQGIGCSGSGAC